LAIAPGHNSWGSWFESERVSCHEPGSILHGSLEAATLNEIAQPLLAEKTDVSIEGINLQQHIEDLKEGEDEMRVRDDKPATGL